MSDDSVWDRVPVVILTGMQKSGTSWLTSKYFGQHPDRFALHANSQELNAVLLTPNEQKFSPEAVREKMRYVAEDAERHGKIVVIIGVFISGMPTDHYAVLPSNLTRTLRAFPKAKLLVTLREQKSILLSVFSELVRGGLTESLDDFLCQPPGDVPFSGIIDFDFYDYSHMYEVYRAAVTTDGFAMVPQEWILNDPRAATAYMAARFGWDWPEPAAGSTDERVRPSLAWPALTAARWGNRLTTPRLRWQRTPIIRPMSVAHWIDRLTPRAINAPVVEARKQRVQAAVGDYFAETNRQVSEKTGIDLGRYGYPV